MTNNQSKRARRETAQRTARRRRGIGFAALAGLVVVGVGSFVVSQAGSGDQVAPLAPDFELQTNTGDTVRLSDFRGQPLAVTFMHTY